MAFLAGNVINIGKIYTRYRNCPSKYFVRKMYLFRKVTIYFFFWKNIISAVSKNEKNSKRKFPSTIRVSRNIYTICVLVSTNFRNDKVSSHDLETGYDVSRWIYLACPGIFPRYNRVEYTRSLHAPIADVTTSLRTTSELFTRHHPYTAHTIRNARLVVMIYLIYAAVTYAIYNVGVRKY